MEAKQAAAIAEMQQAKQQQALSAKAAEDAKFKAEQEVERRRQAESQMDSKQAAAIAEAQQVKQQQALSAKAAEDAKIKAEQEAEKRRGAEARAKAETPRVGRETFAAEAKVSQVQPQDERLRQAAVGAKAKTPRVGRETFAAEARRQRQNTVPLRTTSNPLSALVMNTSSQGAIFPNRESARAPSSQGTAKQPPSNAFPKREQVAPPSSQGTAKHPPTSAFPKREQVAPPSSQGTAKLPPSNAFPNREQVAPPSSQGVAKNPPTNPFPKREQGASPSSQGVAKQPPTNAFPKREKAAPAPSSQSTLTSIANAPNAFPKRGSVVAPSSQGPQQRKKSGNALTNLILGNGNGKAEAKSAPAPIQKEKLEEKPVEVRAKKVEAKSAPAPIQKEKVEEKPVEVGAEKVKAESRPKPKGFGKPAMKMIPSQTPPPSILLKEGMTAEEAEQAREARLSGEPENVSGEAAKTTPSQISPGMTADLAEAVRKARLGVEAEAIRKALLIDSPEPKSDEDSEMAKKSSPKAAQVYVGTKPKFVRTNPPKEASSPKSVANALKDLAMGSSGKKNEPARPQLNRGETSLSKLVASSNQGGLKPAQKVAAPVEKKTLKDFLSNEKPVGSGRKTSSKLGGIASPEEKPIKEERQQAMKEEVIAAAAPVVVKEPSPAAAVVSSLSQLIKNGSSGTRRPADGLGRVEASSSKLGGIAGEVEPSVKQQKVMNAAKPLAPAETTSDDAAPVENAGDANESKSSAEPSASQPAFSSLTDIVVGQERPALAQQNVGKRNSLFPAKKESRLSRLLKK
eukprot:scaffold18582_cov124-Skeletonema_marinoi.AAC.1